MSTSTRLPPRLHFRDRGLPLSPFAMDEVLVACPRCAGRATVRPGHGSERRLVCVSCGLAQERSARRSVWGPPVDPWFEQPLWLTARFGEHTVWAFNREHAALMRDYVAASHRLRAIPRRGQSMIERLPRWYKLRGNRADLTAILDRLIARADD